MTFISNFDINNNLIVYTPNLQQEVELQEKNILDKNSIYYIINSRQDLKTTTAFLKMHSLTRVINAIDITVVDKINNEFRFNVNYQFLSPTINTRFVISTWVSESTSLLSLQTIYPAFNWAEREVWDMYGIFITKHPDLRRILTDYGFVGFPLRKDFPLSGFKETQYEDSIKQVEYNNAELTQSYRLLSFSSAWSN